MNGIDILGHLSNTVDPSSLINYQPKLTVTNTTASPLTLSNNILTVDLSNYSTTASINSLYQKLLTVTKTTASPLALTNNILTVDLTGYQQSLSVVAPLSFISNVMTIDLTAYQKTLTAVLPLVLNSTTKQLSFSTTDLSLSSFNKAVGCTSLGASGQVSLLGSSISTTGSSIAQYLQRVLM